MASAQVGDFSRRRKRSGRGIVPINNGGNSRLRPSSTNPACSEPAAAE
jgi:hypothetical protein